MPRTRSSSSKRRPRAQATCGARHAAHSSVYHYIHYTPSDSRRGLCIGLKLHRVTATLARPSAKPCHICTRTGLAPRQASSLRRSISAHKQPAHIGAQPRRKASVAYQYRTVRSQNCTYQWWQPDRARLLCAAQVCRDQCPFPEQLGPRVRPTATHPSQRLCRASKRVAVGHVHAHAHAPHRRYYTNLLSTVPLLVLTIINGESSEVGLPCLMLARTRARSGGLATMLADYACSL